jgi:hypothetical protein
MRSRSREDLITTLTPPCWRMYISDRYHDRTGVIYLCRSSNFPFFETRAKPLQRQGFITLTPTLLMIVSTVIDRSIFCFTFYTNKKLKINTKLYLLMSILSQHE